MSGYVCDSKSRDDNRQGAAVFESEGRCRLCLFFFIVIGLWQVVLVYSHDLVGIGGMEKVCHQGNNHHQGQ